MMADPSDPAQGWGDDVDAKMLLSGRMQSIDYARRVIPAPLQVPDHTVRIPTMQLGVALLRFAIVAFSIGGAVVALATLSGTVLALIGLVVATIAGTVLYVRELFRSHIRDRDSYNARETNRHVNAHRRLMRHRVHLDDLSVLLAALPESQVAYPGFVRQVISATQSTLADIGILDPRVCVLKPEREYFYVSYYAGAEDPSIIQGRALSIASFENLLTQRSQTVAYRSVFSLGLDDHQLVVLSACGALHRTDEDMLRKVGDVLQSACRLPATV
jgi:hypothetical protein